MECRGENRWNQSEVASWPTGRKLAWLDSKQYSLFLFDTIISINFFTLYFGSQRFHNRPCCFCSWIRLHRQLRWSILRWEWDIDHLKYCDDNHWNQKMDAMILIQGQKKKRLWFFSFWKHLGHVWPNKLGSRRLWTSPLVWPKMLVGPTTKKDQFYIFSTPYIVGPRVYNSLDFITLYSLLLHFLLQTPP